MAVIVTAFGFPSMVVCSVEAPSPFDLDNNARAKEVEGDENRFQDPSQRDATTKKLVEQREYEDENGHLTKKLGRVCGDLLNPRLG